MSGDEFWDAAERMARVLHEQALKVSEAKYQRNLERRRRRYAIAKQFGGAKQKAKPAPEPDWEYEPPTSCECFLGHPPCSWCERQEDPEIGGDGE